MFQLCHQESIHHPVLKLTPRSARGSWRRDSSWPYPAASPSCRTLVDTAELGFLPWCGKWIAPIVVIAAIDRGCRSYFLLFVLKSFSVLGINFYLISPCIFWVPCGDRRVASAGRPHFRAGWNWDQVLILLTQCSCCCSWCGWWLPTIFVAVAVVVLLTMIVNYLVTVGLQSLSLPCEAIRGHRRSFLSIMSGCVRAPSR